MHIYTFGSLNIDHVFRTPRIVRAGETLAAGEYRRYLGGKGANQAAAIARAGGAVTQIGAIAHAELWMRDALAREGVDVSGVETVEADPGQAFIQVDDSGENGIVVYGGANLANNRTGYEHWLDRATPADILLLQNEINDVDWIIREAARRRLRVAFNPAPMHARVLEYPLEDVWLFFVNQTEAEALSGFDEPAMMLKTLIRRFPQCGVVLTLGGNSAMYGREKARDSVAGQTVAIEDTTAAGDTFIGYFCAMMQRGASIKEALIIANRAAALCVSVAGAIRSIPHWARVAEFSERESHRER